jgi:hypothetical protein
MPFFLLVNLFDFDRILYWISNPANVSKNYKDLQKVRILPMTKIIIIYFY